MSEYAAIAVQVAAGIGLAAAAGLRAFLPLFVVGVAERMDWISLRGSFEWLGSGPALVIFGTAVVVEILADKIPFVDHVLDALQSVMKPAAGAVLATALLTDLPPLQATVLGIVAGGSAAGILHLAKAKVRIASTALTGGIANPVLSLAEDVLSIGGAVMSILVPLLALAGLALLAGAGLLLFLLLRRRAPFQMPGVSG